MPAVDLLLVLLGPVTGAGLLAERAGLPAVPAVDLLLVLLGPVTGAGLLAERAGLPAVPAVDLLLVLLGPVTGAGLLAERAGLPAVPAVDLLLVLLRAHACHFQFPPCLDVLLLKYGDDRSGSVLTWRSARQVSLTSGPPLLRLTVAESVTVMASSMAQGRIFLPLACQSRKRTF